MRKRTHAAVWAVAVIFLSAGTSKACQSPQTDYEKRPTSVCVTEGKKVKQC